MNTEPVKIIPISQVAPERDHWLVDVYPKNDDNVEIHWIEASTKHNAGPPLAGNGVSRQSLQPSQTNHAGINFTGA